LSFDNEGNLWIGTEDNGLSKIQSIDLDRDRDQIRFWALTTIPSLSNSLNSNLIYSLYTSRDNLLIWIGTIGSGVNIYDPQQKISHITSLVSLPMIYHIPTLYDLYTWILLINLGWNPQQWIVSF
jgi:ligand-binding sensor domain-containing protein